MSDNSDQKSSGNMDCFVTRSKLTNFFGFMEEDNETYI